MVKVLAAHTTHRHVVNVEVSCKLHSVCIRCFVVGIAFAVFPSLDLFCRTLLGICALHFHGRFVFRKEHDFDEGVVHADDPIPVFSRFLRLWIVGWGVQAILEKIQRRKL